MDYRPIFFDAFISYKRRGGSVWGELLRTVLTYKMGLRVWFDVFDLSGGEWKPQVEYAIPKSLYVIAIFYKGWERHLEDNENEDEFLYELKLARESGCKIIPFFCQDYTYKEFIKSKKMPQFLKELFCGKHSHNAAVHYCHTTIDQTYEKLHQQLIETKLLLRLNLNPLDNCVINTISIDSSEQPKDLIPHWGGIFTLERNFKGVINVTYQKIKGKDVGRTITVSIGVRVDNGPDGYGCQDYWRKSEIDMRIDEPRSQAKELIHDYTFDWDREKKRLEMSNKTGFRKLI